MGQHPAAAPRWPRQLWQGVPGTVECNAGKWGPAAWLQRSLAVLLLFAMPLPSCPPLSLGLHLLQVAVKVLLTADQLEQAEDLVLPPRVMQGLQEEAAVMSRIRHPNVVAFMGLCTLPPCILTGAAGLPKQGRRFGAGRQEQGSKLAWLKLEKHFPCPALQSTAAMDRCTMCFARLARTQTWRRS